MNFKLVFDRWSNHFNDAVESYGSAVDIISPFIQLVAAKKLCAHAGIIRVITRFNLDEFLSGVNNLDALKWLLDCGAQIKGIQNLHAKAYIFGDKCAVVTSANLTSAGLTRNHELGFVTEEPAIIAQCQESAINTAVSKIQY